MRPYLKKLKLFTFFYVEISQKLDYPISIYETKIFYLLFAVTSILLTLVTAKDECRKTEVGFDRDLDQINGV